MAAVHVQTTVAPDGTLVIKNLPSMAGHSVDVIVRDRQEKEERPSKYPLRGTPVKYRDPFGSVAEKDWDVLQ